MIPLAHDFAQHLLRDRRRSEHTARAYRAGAERWIGFLQRHWGGEVDRAALARVAATDLRAFLAQRRAEGLSNASAARQETCSVPRPVCTRMGFARLNPRSTA